MAFSWKKIFQTFSSKAFYVPIFISFFGLLLFPSRAASLSQEDLSGYTNAKYEPVKGVYLGAYIDQAYWIKRDIKAFNERVGKKHASFFRYVTYGQPFPEKWVAEVVAAGAVPQIAWEPNKGLEHVQDDEYLRSFARQAGETGVPIFLRYASEMNGDWCAYSGDPELYIEKWRLVHRVMEEEAPNVAMVWTVFTNPQGNILQYYPGDEYVDWVGVNVYSVLYYNANPETPSLVRDPIELLDFVYKNFSERKPIHISEWAAVNYTVADNKDHGDFAREMIRRMYEGIKKERPRVKAIYYFDANIMETAPAGRRIRDYSVSRKDEILKTYQEIISDDYYLSAVKDNINPDIEVNGKRLSFKHRPIIDGEEIYVYAGDLAAALGRSLSWLGGGKLRLGGWEMRLGESYVLKNGKVVETRLYPLLYRERTYLPLKDFSAALGLSLSFANDNMQNDSSGNIEESSGQNKKKTGVRIMKIAVSPVLSHIKEHLSEEGFDIITFENKNFARLPGEVSAIVISGLDKNFLGMEDLQAQIPVINAEGRTPEEISMEIKERLF